MRALHVLGGLNPGGVERWLRDTVRYRGGSQWSFDFCLLGSRGGAYEPELEALGCRILRCPRLPRTTFPLRFLRLLRGERYDVIHSHVHQFSGLILSIAHLADVPVRLAHSHTHYEGVDTSPRRALYEHAMRALLARSMTAGIACSEEAARFAGDGLRARFHLSPCGIDLRSFMEAKADRSSLRREIGVPPDAWIVGHVGRLAFEKNQAFLIRVFAALIHSAPLAHLVIVGGGPLRMELESLTHRLGLARHVTFTGPRDDVADLLSAFDAFALPSLREGLPAAALEAQAAGLPSVLSAATPEEAIVAPELVQRLDSRNPHEWAAALGCALTRPRGMSVEICRRLREHGFDVAESFSTLTRIYEQLPGCPARVTNDSSLSWNRSLPPI